MALMDLLEGDTLLSRVDDSDDCRSVFASPARQPDTSQQSTHREIIESSFTVA